MMHLKPLLLAIIILLSTNIILAQDVIGGEISYSHVSSTTYNITSIIYSKTSMGINHTGTPTVLWNDITKWENTYFHTFSGPSPNSYNISYLDSFRIANITNIPNSFSEKIELQSELIINPFQGVNNSPTFQFNPSNISVSGGNIIYNPNVIETDGDSLFFDIIPASVTNYNFPIGATINSNSGIYTMPFSQGKHTIAIKVEEWRNGFFIGFVIQEMTIDTDFITSLHEATLFNKQMIIFPNPTSGNFTITQLEEFAGGGILEITNLMGQVVFSQTINASILTIHLASQPKGIYLVKINSAKENVIQKVVLE
ncbi:MAG: T9SS type A sorting domain-containing protein [Flavobacteriales bacterium]|nr:T9SS type A sorting domain-containing protein [Flavobacteriales bacterium]